MKVLIAAALAAFAIPAAAQESADQTSPIYGSLGYSQGGYDGADLGAVQGRLGARLNRYIGGEAEIAKGVEGDHRYVAGARADAKLEHQAAIYGVGFLPLGPKADLYARAGYGNTKVKSEVGGVSASAEGDSWNYGVGGQYFLDGRNGLRADYTRHDFKHDRGEADTWALGYVRRF